MSGEWKATDEPRWTVDLLDRRLRDKGKLDDALYTGTEDERIRRIAWSMKYRGRYRSCRIAVRDFCKDYMSGSTFKSRAYYVRPRSANKLPRLTKNLRFQDSRASRGAESIISTLNEGKAVQVGLARVGGEVKRSKKNPNLLCSFHWVVIVAYGGGGFYFLYLDGWPPYSECFYKKKKRAAMGYIIQDGDALRAPYMAEKGGLVIQGP